MTIVDDHGRREPPLSADEAATLLVFLAYQRATHTWKTAGLDPDALQVSVAASSITLGGLLKHLVRVEDYWFSRRLHGHPAQPPFDAVDRQADPDWEWTSAAADSPDDLRELWRAAVTRSHERVAEALADGGLDGAAKVPWPDGTSPSLRWILVHMVEEYARHNGHADLIREAVDGETGE